MTGRATAGIMRLMELEPDELSEDEINDLLDDDREAGWDDEGYDPDW